MNVLMPTSLSEACAFCAKQPDLIPLAGATDLLVHWPIHPAEHDKSYLDLSHVQELRTIGWASGTLTLGALATYWDVLQDGRAKSEFPLLLEAARQVGAIQIQSRGTWAGNIANGSPAADGVPVLMAYDASVTLTSAGGSRSVPLHEYYTGYRKSVRRPDELISAISMPIRKYDFSVFHKVGARRAQAITKIGVAITRESEAPSLGEGVGGRENFHPWRVVANSVSATVKRCTAVEQLLQSNSPVRKPEDFLPALASDVSPIDDIRSTADYRRTVLARLLYHSLRNVAPAVT
ncbi:MAG: FAD binding domain-containing protein [Phycisphaeraceae bacterium]|nr:FAD binding domain-containing protein [Phycisphaeraceae bacterium]